MEANASYVDRVVSISTYLTMNRRAILQSVGTLGAASLAIKTTSYDAAGSVADDHTVSDASPTIQRGRQILQQAQYDDGTIPSEPPPSEPITDAIDHDTRNTILSIRAVLERLSEHLPERLDETDLDFDELSISKRYTNDKLQLFVEYPEDIAIDHWQSVIDVDEAREEIYAAVDETHRDQLDEMDIEIDHRQRPAARPEHGCTSTVGRFADAQYRADGIAMGAAVRSETLGEIASSGFRGLHEGHAVVVTTAHTFETSDNQDPRELRGVPLYQSRRPHDIGRCQTVGRDTEPGVDAAAVAVEPDTYPSRFLANPGGDSYHGEPIVGTASWELLETHLVEDRPIYKQGAVTGRCEGRLVELREFSNGYRELDVDIHSDGGDSGGPYVVRSDDGLLVAAIHKGVRTNGSERRGIFIDSVCDSLGIDIY